MRTLLGTYLGQNINGLIEQYLYTDQTRDGKEEKKKQKQNILQSSRKRFSRIDLLKFFVVKGSLTRDFRSQFFFMNQCPPGPPVFHWGRFEFFRKFAEIFAN